MTPDDQLEHIRRNLRSTVEPLLRTRAEITELYATNSVVLKDGVADSIHQTTTPGATEALRNIDAVIDYYLQAAQDAAAQITRRTR